MQPPRTPIKLPLGVLGDVMVWRGVGLLMAAVLLSGCVTTERTGVDYAGMMQRLGPPRAGQARIVLLSEKAKGLGLDAAVCDVKIDGNPAGTLKPGTYLYVDRPAGRHELLATQALFPGTPNATLRWNPVAHIFSSQGPASGPAPSPG